MADFDVIVIGGGGAGLAAAYSAAAAGARTLLIEAGKQVGGSTALSGGVLYAAETSVQREQGIADSAEAMFRYCMILNQYRLHAGLIRRLCLESGPAVDWVISLGVRFPAATLYASGLDGIRRGHRAEGNG